MHGYGIKIAQVQVQRSAELASCTFDLEFRHRQIERSICSVVIALTPPECSNFISRGTSKAHIFM
jgi:hypothetical protein